MDHSSQTTSILTASPTQDALERARAEFTDSLIGAGVLSRAGAPGLYDRHSVYTGVLEGVSKLISKTRDETTALCGPDGWAIHRFGPIFPASIYEKTDYIESFPQLTGVISVFTGGDKEHRELLKTRRGGKAWEHFLEPDDMCMVSAACHPLYPQLPHELPAGGITSDVEGWCFRNEPSTDPMRQRAFRMRELVYAGDATTAAQFRLGWVTRVSELLRSLGLPVEEVIANDPFFGRAGKLLATGQLSGDLKTEFVVPVYGPDFEPVAVASCNYAVDHFGSRFDLLDDTGAVAHTSCTAFGLERITLALFAVHGVEASAWPGAVRSALGL
ncbi:Amino acid--[acyl-carrier-protein] ligase [Corynebacterium capitovis DSM 44611]|uniref:aminoacyl--tRNA ligase-related protein n=1 Tax=Corynebacterium capitovis TaxID=131081 RepID=UPI0003778EB5|nr:aminoacyl--tRNA ligase-related protein [Corynebacterium capitovis]WKD57214.1 Amino acid--[acyl-carrier-protein] ligase [Corynebacterium capitovis DSM 44611]